MGIQNILRSHDDMVSRRMMFGGIVSVVVFSFVPVDAELFVRDFVT